MTRLARVSMLRSNAARVTTLTVAALTAMTMLSAVPHALGQPRSPDDEVIQTSATNRQTSPQDSFRLRARDEMADWRLKMRAFDEKVDAGSQRHVDAAETRLPLAWDDTEVEARNVQSASAQDWARTKLAYEAASHRMTMAWERVRL
jgi:predicted membrane-bound mannosyltransferase